MDSVSGDGSTVSQEQSTPRHSDTNAERNSSMEHQNISAQDNKASDDERDRTQKEQDLLALLGDEGYQEYLRQECQS